MVRGKCGRRVRVVQRQVVVREEVLHALQVGEARRPPPAAAAAHQPLILGQALDLETKRERFY